MGVSTIQDMFRPVALAAVAFVLSPASARAVETMRISMGPDRVEVQVVALGLGFGHDREEATYAPSPGGRAALRVVKGKIDVDGAPFPADAVRFRAGHDAFDAGAPGRRSISVDGFSVRGDVVVRLHRGKLQLINVIALEDYLAAVLGSEMPKSFPLEALKAQAIAARTYALDKKLKAIDAPFHLGSSVLHQVYGGAQREDPRTLDAVLATRGEVLTYDLAPIEAYFHASCGGRTESGAEALGRDLPYLASVECPCGGLAHTKWQLALEDRELRVLQRSPTGRARRVSLSRGRQVTAVRFREQVGYTKLKSLAFDVEEQGAKVLVKGRGYGHGAGLCQWGAKSLADRGWSYRQILDHYYRGAELQVLY